jgi:hypothetical protein
MSARRPPAGISGARGPGEADMSGPGCLAGGLAALMIAIAVYCAGRLAVSRLRGQDTEVAADGLHVMMGVAMAGMFEPRLTLIPGAAWRAVFAVAAAWFAWQAIRAGRRPSARCAHPAAHAVECAAMVYMVLPVGSWPSGRGLGMTMPGMSQGTTVGNPALTLLLALFMLGYVLWAIDRLAVLSRTPAAATPRLAGATRPPLAALTVPTTAGILGPSGPGPTADSRRPPGRTALAPRLAACYKIAMAITMGYMLILML